MKRSRLTPLPDRRAAAPLRRIAWLLVVTLVFGLCATPAGHLLRSWGGGPEVTHAGEVPCPDPADDDHPCGPGCPCACCHVPFAILPLAPRATTALDLPAWEASLPPPAAWQPKDIRRRIFHPPRA